MVQDGIKTAYAYDALGQLIRVDDGQENATWLYTYDNGGNIRSKQKFALGVTTGEPLESKHFSYSNDAWRDQLTAVDGVAITYDAIGNPLSDGTWSYTWQNGRQLQKMQKQGETVEFVYNENGLRVQKTATSTGVTKYTLHGKNVVHMTQGEDELHFFYDAQNRPAVVVYNGAAYAYVKSLQGDIVAILDENGNAVVSYGYDAWGAPLWCTGELAETLGKVQPFRYRGYVYDEETELYYLRSRYYAALRSRMLNHDSRLFKNETFEFNGYVYCMNNPIAYHDPSGTCVSCETVDEVTAIVLPNDRVRYGVLTLIGSCILIWILLDKVLKKIPAGVGVSVSFVLFLILRSWTKQDPIQLSDNLLNVTWLKSVLAYIGFPQAGFSSTDYFPLLPWIFLFATGYFLYSFLQEKGLINRLFGKGKVPGINFLGKHSLIIYMIHQPICYVVAFLVSEIF